MDCTIFSFLRDFHSREDGAVTVDWVVLTAGIFGFGILIVGLIAQGATDPADSVGATLSSADIQAVNFD
ncbi:hypothetical protein [Wenxinia saemankumensis]|uniref:Flp pilus assembly protein, pilin Flp n=1 Tax=Wenxinia saemankumensis TaxID=1447782 RepID=A0A1M6GUY3_9RHOB|nr:hypothetical protein [Wenxinia saemankumensis]SHJ13776.1 hypothetical protein SAMN05444417_2943 [Wenxinia saemankumensis]